MKKQKFDILFEDILSKLSINTIQEAKKKEADPYHFDVGDKTFTVVNLKFEQFEDMINTLKDEGYKVVNPRKNAYRIRKTKESDGWKLWNEIKKNHADWFDKYTFGVYANRISYCRMAEIN